MTTADSSSKTLFNEASQSSFENYYNKICQLTIDCTPQDFQSVLTLFNKKFADLFDFDQYSTIITDSKNTALFETLMKILMTYNKDFDLQTAIVQTMRIFSRSRKGISPLLTLEFHSSLMQTLQSNRRKLVIQSLSCLCNTCALNTKEIQENALKYESYSIIIRNLQENQIFKKVENTKIQYLSFLLLFYFTVNKEIQKILYPNDTFFRFMFDLFLSKTKHFQNINFWNRSTVITDDNKNTTEDEIQFNTSDDCKLICEILKVIFNFTMHEQSVLKFKLDKYPAFYQRLVVGRAVAILRLDNFEYESEFSLDVDAKHLQHLLSTPGLISVKKNICNVSLYNADILGMNMHANDAIAIGQLFEFDAIHTRYDHQSQKNLCPILMFLKAVCEYNGKFRDSLKKYIFGEDAEPDDEESDEESDDERGANMAPKLKNYDKNEITLKNFLIQYLTSIDYSLKRMTGEFLFQLCAENTSEMIRLTGFGNSIGMLVDKGIPGFAGMGNSAVDLGELAKNKNFRQSLNSQKKKNSNPKQEMQKHMQKMKQKKSGNVNENGNTAKVKDQKNKSNTNNDTSVADDNES